MIIFPPIWI